MDYEIELRKKIKDTVSKYNYQLNGIEKRKIEETIIDCKNKNIEIDKIIKSLENKIKNKIESNELKNLKTINFFKYAEIILNRKLTNEEIMEMFYSFKLDNETLKMSIDLLTEGKTDELQKIINENIIIADGYIFCKKRNMIRLNNFVAYDIQQGNIQLHAAMYDFHPIIRELFKKYGKGAREEFFKLYSSSVKEALEKCKIILNNDPTLSGVSAISALVKDYSEIFIENNMKVGPIPEELAMQIFKNLDPNSIWGAYISKEELLENSKKI